METAIIKAQDLEGNLPDLEKATLAPLPITGEYWSPVEAGEKKRVFFYDIRVESLPDRQTGEDIELPVAYFVEVKNGEKKIIRQGGARLVSVFESLYKAKRIEVGMPFEIVYEGLTRTANGNNIGKWRITPLATA